MKYELLTPDVIVPGMRNLYRIKALQDFANLANGTIIKAGDLGGCIADEDGLSQEETCWVDFNSKVHGRARVYGDAYVASSQVFGNSLIFDSAFVGLSTVKGSAKIYESAAVSDGSVVSDYAEVFGEAQVHSAFLTQKASVYGSARISSNTSVSGDARIKDANIYGGAFVTGVADIRRQKDVVWFSNVGSENGILTVFRTRGTSLAVSRGCYYATIDAFLAACAASHGPNSKITKEYQLLIEVAKSRILD